jgi:outer membrane receptor protein involved in Fe transport
LKANRKVYCAVAAILGAHAAAANAAAPAAEATPTEADQSLAIGEVIVTAQRREESIQNVPIQVTALTSETLTQLNISTFEDYLKVLPNVSASTHGPGQGQIYMRGLATTEDGNQSTGATGSFPNVAVYLDDQSAQLPGRNLDIYAADLERVEVLEGPQGTLFGAGAQAGVIRYITNKPKLNTTEAVLNGGYGITAHGDPNTSVDATLNLPLINDKLAFRAVIYSDSRGGYIDNVQSTFTRKDNDRGIIGYFGGVTPPSTPVNNDKIAGSNINPVTYKGGRASLLYQINDDWNALVTQSYQNMEADGVFAEMPFGSDGQKLDPLQVTLYTPNVDRDKFTNTSWTLNGRIGALKAVYTGGYLIRTVDQVADYTNYARGVYADYYQCVLAGSPFAYDPVTKKNVKTGTGTGNCYSPVSTFKVHERNIHQSHEFRVSTPGDWRIRGIGGLYWEQFIIHNESDWYYRDPQAGFSPLKPVDGATLNNPNIRDPDDSFYDDVTRGYNQKAVFGSFDFDIIPKTLTITGGTRYYRMDTYQTGAIQGSFGCRPGGIYLNQKFTPATTDEPCQSGTNLNTLVVPPGNSAFSDQSVGLAKRYSGFKSRGNLTWHVTDDALVYYTWSQGFRPGGFNRASGFVSAAASPLANIFVTPIGFKPDTLTNNEIGWKTEWLDHRIQFNGAVYYEDWKDVQIGLFNPGLLGNLTFSSNGPEYHVKGIETEITGRVTRELTLTGSASWNRSELFKEVTFNDKNGNPIDFEALGLHNPYGTKGSPLAQSPPFQFNIRARYDVPAINDYMPFVQVSANHRGGSYSTTDALQTEIDQVTPTRYYQPGYTQYDASIGVAKDAWMVQLYGTNLTDNRGVLYSSYSQFVKMNNITRPRTLTLQMSYKFKEK